MREHTRARDSCILAFSRVERPRIVWRCSLLIVDISHNMTRVGECDVPIRVAEFGLDTMNTHGCTSVGMPLKSVARPSCLDKASNELPKLAGNKKLSNPSLRRLVRPSSKISVLDGRFRQSGNKLQSLVEQITYKDVCNKEIPFQDSHLPQADDRGDHRTSYEEALSNRYRDN